MGQEASPGERNPRGCPGTMPRGSRPADCKSRMPKWKDIMGVTRSSDVLGVEARAKGGREPLEKTGPGGGRHLVAWRKVHDFGGEMGTGSTVVPEMRGSP